MNVYDFDNTIYRGDSTVDFFLFCLKRHPKQLLLLPRTAAAFIAFKRGKADITATKEKFFSFLSELKDVDREITLFWKKHRCKIKEWYIYARKKDDIVISASPEFLLAPVCGELGIKCIASRVNKKTGRYTGINCSGEEKVVRFKESEGKAEIDTFYSDSVSDLPLAKLAGRSYMVKGDRVEPWDVSGEAAK